MSLLLCSKCQKYSPSEPTKLYDKTMTRRGEITFNSHFKDLMFKQSDLEKDEMVNYYIEVCMILILVAASLIWIQFTSVITYQEFINGSLSITLLPLSSHCSIRYAPTVLKTLYIMLSFY